MRRIFVTLVMLIGCDTAASVTSSQYPGLHCLNSQGDAFALCINDHSETFVCFASSSAGTAFCLRAVPAEELRSRK